MAEEEGEQQRANVRAVHVGVGHQDHAAVAELGQVEVLLADARADGLDDLEDFLVAEDLVQAGLFDVQNLAADRQNGLRFRVAVALGRAGRRIALHDEQLGRVHVAAGAIDQLAGQAGPGQGALPGGLAGLAGSLASQRRLHGLADDALRVGGVLLEEVSEHLVDRGLDERAHLAVAELRLRLTLELRLRDLDRNDRSEALADVLALRRRVVRPQQVALARVVVEGARQGRAEARQVRAALDRVDVVHERERRLAVGVGVLERDLKDQTLLHVFLLEIHRRRVQRRLALVEVLGELANAVVEAERLRRTAALVRDRDGQAGIEVRQLAHAVGENVVVEIDLAEDLRVGLEMHQGAGPSALAGDFEPLCGLAALEAHGPDLALTADRGAQPLGQGVDDAHADAVQTTRDLVRVPVEFGARAELGEAHLERGQLLAVHELGPHRDAAPVVLDADTAIIENDDGDAPARPGHRLVDRVIEDLVDQVVQPPQARIPNVHTGPLAHVLGALEHEHVGFVIRRRWLRVSHRPLSHHAPLAHHSVPSGPGAPQPATTNRTP